MMEEAAGDVPVALPPAEEQPCAQQPEVHAPPTATRKGRRASLVIAETESQLNSLSSEGARINDVLAEMEALLASSRLQSSVLLQEVQPMKDPEIPLEEKVEVEVVKPGAPLRLSARTCASHSVPSQALAGATCPTTAAGTPLALAPPKLARDLPGMVFLDSLGDGGKFVGQARGG